MAEIGSDEWIHAPFRAIVHGFGTFADHCTMNGYALPALTTLPSPHSAPRIA